MQSTTSESWSLDEGEIKTGSFSREGGIGLRAVRGETTAFASSDIIAARALDNFADIARTAKTRGEKIHTGKIQSSGIRCARFAPSVFAATEDIVVAEPQHIKDRHFAPCADALARQSDNRTWKMLSPEWKHHMKRCWLCAPTKLIGAADLYALASMTKVHPNRRAARGQNCFARCAKHNRQPKRGHLANGAVPMPSRAQAVSFL